MVPPRLLAMRAGMDILASDHKPVAAEVTCMVPSFLVSFLLQVPYRRRVIDAD